MVAVVHKF